MLGIAVSATPKKMPTASHCWHLGFQFSIGCEPFVALLADAMRPRDVLAIFAGRRFFLRILFHRFVSTFFGYRDHLLGK